MATEKSSVDSCLPTLPVSSGGLIKICDINESILEKLKQDCLTTDHVFILQSLHNRQFALLDVYDKNFTAERALLNYQTLERKQLIVPDPGDHSYYIISLEGKDYLLSLVTLSTTISFPKHALSREEKNRVFEEWWNTYPATADWEAEGRTFTSGRSLRSGTREENRRAYLKILNEGLYTHQQLLACLKYEIAAKKRQSMQTGNNCLSFMQGSLTYLGNRTFEHFIALSQQGEVQDVSRSYLEIG